MRRIAFSSFASMVIMAGLLSGPAGTLAWPQAQAFLGLVTLCGFATALWLHRTAPDLLAERGKSAVAANQRPRDRLVMGALLAFFAVWLVVMALDVRRYGWSQVPLWAQALGAALIVATCAGCVAVFRANRFASTQIKLQADRGQTVIATGPYAVVRHPMYASALPLIVGTPLLLGSLWGLLGVAFALPLLAARTLGEEDLLMEGLPGYRDYAARVRWRLVPGVW